MPSGSGSMRSSRRLVHVAIGTEIHGGIQAASALFGRALQAWAHLRCLEYKRIEVASVSWWTRLRVATRVQMEQGPHSQGVLFFDHVGPARLQALVPGSLRRSYAVFLHGIEVWRTPLPTTTAALRQAKLLLSNSDHTRRRARQFVPELPQVRVVPLALADGRREGVVDRQLVGQLPGDYFLVVGRMHPQERYKGHDLILDAIAGLRRQGVRQPCVFVGAGRTERASRPGHGI